MNGSSDISSYFAAVYRGWIIYTALLMFAPFQMELFMLFEFGELRMASGVWNFRDAVILF